MNYRDELEWLQEQERRHIDRLRESNALLRAALERIQAIPFTAENGFSVAWAIAGEALTEVDKDDR
jgi:hypothetical protein